MQATSLPEYLYRITQAGSRTPENDGFKAPTRIEYAPNDERAIEVTRCHLNWLDTEEDWWISTFGNKDHARRWAEIWRVNHPNMYCAMEIFLTANIKGRIFNAAKFIQHFDIPLKQSLDISQFHDEYLVLNQIPESAVLGSVPFITSGEQEAATNLPRSRCIQKNVLTPPVHILYFESFNLINLPARLFRVIYAGGKALYKDHDEGLAAHSQTNPRLLRDSDFKKSIQLQVNWDDTLANRSLHNMFSVHSKRDSALKWAQSLQRGNQRSAIGIAHIDTLKLGDLSSRWVYHAAYVIKELRIPLNQGQRISEFYHEYLVLNRIPAQAIEKIENLTPHINASVEQKAKQHSVLSGSPMYVHTGLAIVGRQFAD